MINSFDASKLIRKRSKLIISYSAVILKRYYTFCLQQQFNEYTNNVLRDTGGATIKRRYDRQKLECIQVNLWKRTLVATEDRSQVRSASSWLGSWPRQNHFVPRFCSPRPHCYSFCCSSCYRYHFSVPQMQNLQHTNRKNVKLRIHEDPET